ncbi:hypothetical protein DLV40_13965 [Shigella flexneri]|nr:hypothetical protein [Shigella flexneri]EGE3642167.1 hypothetical protein [Shigella flexneri]URY12489.1 hypothetical protein [Shigella phage ESh20]
MSNKEQEALAIFKSEDKSIAFVSEAWCRDLGYDWYIFLCAKKDVKPVDETRFKELYNICQEGYEEHYEGSLNPVNSKASDLFY